jgi:hypothetical protein
MPVEEAARIVYRPLPPFDRAARWATDLKGREREREDRWDAALDFRDCLPLGNVVLGLCAVCANRSGFRSYWHYWRYWHTRQSQSAAVRGRATYSLAAPPEYHRVDLIVARGPAGRST